MNRMSVKRGNSGYSPEDDMEDRNNEMLGTLQEKTEQWKNMALKMKSMFTDDLAELTTLTANMETSGTLISKSRRYVASITEDPTYIGVFKIAMVVFISLCLLYFGPKCIYKFFSGKEN